MCRNQNYYTQSNKRVAKMRVVKKLLKNFFCGCALAGCWLSTFLLKKSAKFKNLIKGKLSPQTKKDTVLVSFYWLGMRGFPLGFLLA